MKTFFEKRDAWKAYAKKQLLENPDIMTHWTNDSNLTMYPNGNVVVSYPNSNIEDIVFEKAVISIHEFFEKMIP